MSNRQGLLWRTRQTCGSHQSIASYIQERHITGTMVMRRDTLVMWHRMKWTCYCWAFAYLLAILKYISKCDCPLCLFQVKIKVIRGHKESVKSCQFLRNDKNILTASADSSVVLWDTESGSSIHTYAGHKSCATFAKANPCSKQWVFSSYYKCDWSQNVMP